MTAQDARLELRGASLVLVGAYKAQAAVRVGDAVKVAGDWQLAPTEGDQDDVIGYAWGSAAAGQPLDVIVAGLARTVPVVAVAAGDVLTPDVQRGRSKRAASLAGLPAYLSSRKHGVAAESKPAGKPAWAHVKTIGH